jgi:hypothetical protein
MHPFFTDVVWPAHSRLPEPCGHAFPSALTLAHLTRAAAASLALTAGLLRRAALSEVTQEAQILHAFFPRFNASVNQSVGWALTC